VLLGEDYWRATVPPGHNDDGLSGPSWARRSVFEGGVVDARRRRSSSDSVQQLWAISVVGVEATLHMPTRWRMEINVERARQRSSHVRSGKMQ
jgi:hypothetical protein